MSAFNRSTLRLPVAVLAATLPLCALGAAPTPALPRAPAGLDLAAHVPATATVPAAPTLLVFVSFAMPPASLRALAAQAEQAGAVLLWRGLKDGSLRATVAAVQDVIGAHRVAAQIDPTAFDRYGVTAVPTFVLAEGSAASASAARAPDCAAPVCAPAFVAVTGDVSLAYALRFMMRQAPAAAPRAHALLTRLGQP